MLKVYGYEDSPYVMRVEWILKELNIAYEFVRVDLLSNEQNTNWYLNISPIGQVPAIEADGGVRVFDSLAIIKYVALKSNSTLYPKDFTKQIAVDSWLQFGSFEVGEPISKLCWQRFWKPKLTKREPDLSYCERLEKQLSFGAPKLDRMLGDHEYISGDSFTVADIAAFPLIVLADRAEFSLDVYPNIASWVERIKKRPAVSQTQYNFSR